MKFYDFKDSNRAKVMVLGMPKSGKTGLIATVANAGYRVLYHDIDNNPGIMNTYLTEEGKKNIYYNAYTPRAESSWDEFTKMAEHWKTKDEDLGRCVDMGSDTVVVVDTGTLLSHICLKKVLKDNNTSLESPSFNINLWGVMGEKFLNLFSRLAGPKFKHHLIINAHLRTYEKYDKKSQALVSSQVGPNFAGQQLSVALPPYMNNIFLVQPDDVGKRKLITLSTKEIPYLGTSAPKIIKPEEDMDLGDIIRRIESV